ncbi:hypothetical protein ACFQE1_03275, partial [Halobium palmae]
MATHTQSPDDSPNDLVPVDTARTYLRIRPADTPLDARTLETQFRRLHRLEPRSGGGVLDKLRGSARPTIEWVLTTTGSSTGITYLVGIDDEELLDGLERVLRSMLPDSSEFERVTHTPESLLSPAIDPVGVEYRGVTTHAKDWQTRLQPFTDLRPASTDDRATPRIPLAGFVETMADAACPITYQVLLTPKPDWSTDADVRRLDLREGTDTVGGRLSNAVFGPSPEGEGTDHLLAADRERLAHLDDRDCSRSFVVNARAV